MFIVCISTLLCYGKTSEMGCVLSCLGTNSSSCILYNCPAVKENKLENTMQHIKP